MYYFERLLDKAEPASCLVNLFVLVFFSAFEAREAIFDEVRIEFFAILVCTSFRDLVRL
jgi:hypothetical protein